MYHAAFTNSDDEIPQKIEDLVLCGQMQYTPGLLHLLQQMRSSSASNEVIVTTKAYAYSFMFVSI